MIKAVLFDLDGTLLPMNQDLFVKLYFSGITKKLQPFGYEPKKLLETIYGGTIAMVKNDGGALNCERFWECFEKQFGKEKLNDMPIFDDYYKNEFVGAKAACGYNEHSAEIVKLIKSKGVKVILATNPIFPSIATHTRMAWAGLDKDDFDLITTYDNSHFCKPNPDYYREILSRFDLSPSECIMVGNDIGEDMVAATLGMKTFLLTDCLIAENETDKDKYNNGGFDELEKFLADELSKN